MMLLPSSSMMFHKAGMLAPDGRCKVCHDLATQPCILPIQALDAAADGYVRSEACVMLLLGPPTEDDGHVLLAGTAVNQAGQSSALTAPNGPSQQQVLRAALASANVAPGTLAALQLHGTGTPLGDPIEVCRACA